MDTINAVALVVFDSECRVFLLKELKAREDYCKKVGMLSFPITLIANGEDKDLSLVRLITKEIGQPIQRLPMFFGDYEIPLNTKYSVRLSVYTGVVNDGFFTARPSDLYVDHYGWMFPRQILELPSDEIRLEVKPVIRSYLTI